jgi:hypothetical protein
MPHSSTVLFAGLRCWNHSLSPAIDNRENSETKNKLCSADKKVSALVRQSSPSRKNILLTMETTAREVMNYISTDVRTSA